LTFQDFCVDTWRMEEKQFYEEIGRLLEQDHNFVPRSRRRTRWFPRYPGNGRFEGHGIVRWYNSESIFMSFRDPQLIGSYASPEAALAALRGALDATPRPEKEGVDSTPAISPG